MTNPEEELTNCILQNLAKDESQRRKHASFWNFYSKSCTELGVFSQVLETLQKDFGAKISEWGLCEQDPPDLFARLDNGTLKGIEVTELVNEKAIQAQISESAEYRGELAHFGFDAAVTALRQILASKEAKTAPRASDYDSLVLLIHTDEGKLDHAQFERHAGQIFPAGSSVFDAVYLLFSYHPDSDHYPLIRLV